VICPACGTRLEAVLVVHDADGVPDLEVREAWSRVEQDALLREAKRGEKEDPTW
jgi:hypothetical protein